MVFIWIIFILKGIYSVFWEFMIEDYKKNVGVFCSRGVIKIKVLNVLMIFWDKFI